MKKSKSLRNLTIIAAASVALLGFGVAQADGSASPAEPAHLEYCDGVPKLDGRGGGLGAHRWGAFENRSGNDRQQGLRDGSGPHNANPPRLGQQGAGEGRRVGNCDGERSRDRKRDGSGRGRGGAGGGPGSRGR